MTTTARRFFNTAGPIKKDMHYHVPPLARLDVEDLMLLIHQEKYFVLHAPRQTGKTSALFDLRKELNASGEFRCLYVNVEVGQSAREDVAAAMRAILGQMASEAEYGISDPTLGKMGSRHLRGVWPAPGFPGKPLPAGPSRTPGRWCS